MTNDAIPRLQVNYWHVLPSGVPIRQEVRAGDPRNKEWAGSEEWDLGSSSHPRFYPVLLIQMILSQSQGENGISS